MLEIFFSEMGTFYNFKNKSLLINHWFNYGSIREKLNEQDYYEKVIKEEPEIRIWYNSNQPIFLASFYWLCSFLKDIDYKGIVYRESNVKIIGSDLYGLTKNDIIKLTNNRNLIPEQEIETSSIKWKQLCKENTDFRIIKNGELVSDFPDKKSNLSESEKSVFNAIKKLRISTTTGLQGSSVVANIMGFYNDFNVGDQTIWAIIQKLSNRETPLITLIPTRTNTETNSYRDFECKLTKEGDRLTIN